MRVLLTGASGFIGQQIYWQLIRSGHQVRVAVRDPAAFMARFPDADTVLADFACHHSVQDWLPHLLDEHGQPALDAVINAVGIIREQPGQSFDALHYRAPAALFDACVQARVSRVIQISALGSDEQAESRYHLSKRAADQHLARLPLNWTVLRPSIVWGVGAGSSELFRALAALPLTPVIGQGEQQLQPIMVPDLVKAVLLCLERDMAQQCVVDAVGPQPLCFVDLLALQRQWLGLGKLRPLFIPPGIALRLGQLAEKLGHSPVSRDSVAMLLRGNSGDVSGFEQVFGFTPDSLTSQLQQQPATQAERWFAGLFFMPQLLTFTLALVWILTCLCSLGLYPLADSLQLLARTGIEGPTATVLLYGGALCDLLLGLMMLSPRWRKTALLSQLGLMLTYTLIISVQIPEFWLHPFGPISKNLPMAAATLCLLIMSRRPTWNI